MDMRQSAKPCFRRGQWVEVEAGFFDVRNVGRVERAVVVSDGADHVLIEFRRQQLAIPKGRGYIAAVFALRRGGHGSLRGNAGPVPTVGFKLRDA